MQIEDDRILVNGTGFTVVMPSSDMSVQRVWPSVAWANKTDPAASMRDFLADSTASIAKWTKR